MRRGTFHRGGRGGRGTTPDYYKKFSGRGGRGPTSPRPDPTTPTPQSADPPSPQTHAHLISTLRSLDQKPYPYYRSIESSYINDLEGYELIISRPQSDPYAKPTACKVVVAAETAGFPPVSYQNKVRSVALGDYLNRVFWECCRQMGADLASGGEGWSGNKGGDIEVG
jgi:hypothetical protein